MFDLEFAVVILRMCSYASEFLPSQSYTIEKIRGMSLADIRNAGDDVAAILPWPAPALTPKGSLLRVQHLAFAGLKSRCEGRVRVSRDRLRCAIQVALKIGIDSNAMSDMGELEKEMRRRVFYNLYIWDGYEDEDPYSNLSTDYRSQPPIPAAGPHCHSPLLDS